MNRLKLGVNIDHVATLRQARLVAYPEPLQAALLAEQAGADSITVHLREDRRHIQARDVRLLRETLSVPLNLELALADEMLDFAEQLRPDYCCLVPERRAELTTEGGLDVVGQPDRVKAACARLGAAGISVSLFVDAEMQQLEAAARLGADMIEIHTGHYADAHDARQRDEALDKIRLAAVAAHEAGLQVNAGHGLHYHNVRPIAAIPAIVELNIGHSIVARAVFCGICQAVSDMRQLLDATRPA